MTTHDYEREALAIKARNVHFDWSEVPLHYLPGEPVATQVYNLMHLLLPEGERAMAQAVADALPHIDDPRLREEALGFVGQENMHATAHESGRAFLEAHGVPVQPVVDRLGFLIDNVLNAPRLTGRARHEWLKERLGVFAAMEHFTAVIGASFLTNEHLEAMHPVMRDLLRWHGAEEIEHRAVVYDVYQHLDGSYARRVRTAILGSSTLLVVFLLTLRHLVRNDPAPGKAKHPVLNFLSAMRRGVIPSLAVFIKEMPPYLRPGFHPDQMDGMDLAIRYLATSPAARAAQ